jgi:chromosome segregation ATPase
MAGIHAVAKLAADLIDAWQRISDLERESRHLKTRILELEGGQEEMQATIRARNEECADLERELAQEKEAAKAAHDAWCAQQADIERLERELADRNNECNHFIEALFNQDCEIERFERELESQATALREAYEVWAGSDGFIPKTAPEAYQQNLINQMVAIIIKAAEPKDSMGE